ncbi:hypothetical protein, partial [Brasilonema sp. UFV-L1]|uniref:HNH endonuclease n=1 Tax=Brasilonema sp. UFV-L1 TaxID=2234130 RepID=UPI0016AA4BA1
NPLLVMRHRSFSGFDETAKGDIEVHHIRALKDLKTKGRKEKPQWMQIMSARKRKTLMVCPKCHDVIHAGKPTSRQVSGIKVLESRVPGNS